MNFLVRTIKNSLVTRNLELRTFLLFSLVLFIACGDFMEPVESTPEPTAYEFNYWLLNQTYLYEEELKDLPEKGDSIPLLYESLSDRYTRYYPPSKSEAAENQMNTSIVEGDLGMEYLVIYTEGDDHPYPILISRVYADSPAGNLAAHKTLRGLAGTCCSISCLNLAQHIDREANRQLGDAHIGVACAVADRNALFPAGIERHMVDACERDSNHLERCI